MLRILTNSGCVLLFLFSGSASVADKPSSGGPGTSHISIHPENPKYFLFRGRPRVLIAATEHYGSVVNRAFDFEKYLDDAAEKHQTVTRTFLLFREQQSVRNPYSPIKAESPDFVTPWPRTGRGTALDGEPKYDLDQWNPEYFDRLQRFLRKASNLGIVVELTIFSNTYGDNVWTLNPLNAQNNLQDVGKGTWQDYNSMRDEQLLSRQLAYARKIIHETSAYDNIYYEICNEPGGGFPNHATPADVDAWQRKVAHVIRVELERLGRKHLIFGSQSFSYDPKFRQELDASFGEMPVAAVNVHPLPGTILSGRDFQLGNFMSKELRLAEFAEFCSATQRLTKPCIHDEDNTASMYRDETGWTIHRKRAWTAVLRQTHYDFIDFSIICGSETGTKESNRKIRTWMKHLSDFIHDFDFIHARPSNDWIDVKLPHVVCSSLAKSGDDYIAYLADNREVADVNAGQPIRGLVTLRLPDGNYTARLYSPTSGEYSPGQNLADGKMVELTLAPFRHDIALRVTKR